jgi:hypothetical protein
MENRVEVLSWMELRFALGTAQEGTLCYMQALVRKTSLSGPGAHNFALDKMHIFRSSLHVFVTEWQLRKLIVVLEEALLIRAD